MERSLTALTSCAATGDGNLLELAMQVRGIWCALFHVIYSPCASQASRDRCTVGEISTALEEVG